MDSDSGPCPTIAYGSRGALRLVLIFRSLYVSNFVVLLTRCVYMYSRYTRRNLASIRGRFHS